MLTKIQCGDGSVHIASSRSGQKVQQLMIIMKSVYTVSRVIIIQQELETFFYIAESAYLKNQIMRR